MIRDGRPYSNENGFEDGELISERRYDSKEYQKKPQHTHWKDKLWIEAHLAE